MLNFGQITGSVIKEQCLVDNALIRMANDKARSDEEFQPGLRSQPGCVG